MKTKTQVKRMIIEHEEEIKVYELLVKNRELSPGLGAQFIHTLNQRIKILNWVLE